MSSEQAKITSKMVRGLVNHLVKKGVSRELVLSQLQIDEQDLNNPDYYFLLEIYNDLYQLGEVQTGDTCLGMSFGLDSDPDVGSQFGLIARTCETVADVLKYQLRFSSLVRNFDRFEIITEGENFIIRWSSESPTTFHLIEEIFSRRSAFINNYVLGAGNTFFKQVDFRHSLNNRDHTYLETIMDCPIKFEQPYNQIISSQSALKLTLKTPDRDLREFYEGLAQKKLVEQSQNSIVARVSRLLMNALPDVLTLEHLSEDLSVSPRTLQRQLQQNGYTLKELCNEVKRKVALESLKAGHSLVTISYKLGFSEQSAFQRAFKRWQGCTPKEFQQLYLHNLNTEE
ncbi:helix-turn-helix domain-containing protein [Alkalimarinus alittae]|uniref:AraC family transcriptional regulator n=1 Tax=Alkalimarinus alittae TaxID=2961619 RepID=A0ABY6MY84_9ALTE|nr:AraC family transcriptional regulator [Alkalimarinus alittae]UZE94791.1 AraC family transcriptional regulator [Alkalimarinus alittae]